MERERIEDLQTGREVTFEQMIDTLSRARVVYVGESHDDEGHHAAQLAILTALHRRDSRLALGVEMVQRPYQAALDAWVESDGGAAAEATLLEEVEWEARWGFDFALYRPLFEYCRQHRIPIVALNARKELTRAVARRGVEGISPELTAELPELDLEDAEHRTMIRDALSEHPNLTEAFFERMYSAQVVWDETMADSVARTLSAADGPHRLVVLAGEFHVRGGLGIPRRAARRGAEPYEIVLPFTPGEEASPPADATSSSSSEAARPPSRYRWVGSRRPPTP